MGGGGPGRKTSKRGEINVCWYFTFTQNMPPPLPQSYRYIRPCEQVLDGGNTMTDITHPKLLKSYYMEDHVNE